MVKLPPGKGGWEIRKHTEEWKGAGKVPISSQCRRLGRKVLFWNAGCDTAQEIDLFTSRKVQWARVALTHHALPVCLSTG